MSSTTLLRVLRLPWQERAPLLPQRSLQRLTRSALTVAALAFFALFVFLPLLVVYGEALRHGLPSVWAALTDDDALAAMRLSLKILVLVVPVNACFGLAAAWALSKFEFRGKQTLIALLDVPLAVSPVVAGLIFVLLFGRQGWWGSALAELGIKVIFATPGIVLASLFVTGPFITRQLLPLMAAQGRSQEEASLLLGANGLQTFFLVSLPNVRWALLHGVSLCAARVLGEFGAVSVVSGHIRGQTMTLPLQVEVLYNEYDSAAAFTLASLLTTLALVSLLLKNQAARRLGGTAEDAAATEEATWS